MCLRTFIFRLCNYTFQFRLRVGNQSALLKCKLLVQTPSRAGSKPPKEESQGKMPKEELREVFAAFASFGGRASSDGATELDGAKFAKLCRESLLLNSSFNSTSVDIIFSKVKPKVNHRSIQHAICKFSPSVCAAL